MALATPQVFGPLLTNIIVAIIILLLGFVVGKILGSGLHKVFTAIFAGKRIRGKNNSTFALGLSNLISTAVYIIAVIFAMERLGITGIVLKVLLGVIAVILLGYVLFLFIDFFTNFYFGANIILANKIVKGDKIKIKKIEGTVKKISLVNTQVITDAGELYIFSNKIIFKHKFLKE